MWGGIYAVLFSISTILSSENPIKNGFPEGPPKVMQNIPCPMWNFKTKLLAKKFNIRSMKIRDLGLFKGGNHFR